MCISIYLSIHIYICIHYTYIYIYTYTLYLSLKGPVQKIGERYVSLCLEPLCFQTSYAQGRKKSDQFRHRLRGCLRPVRLLRAWISEGLTQADS